MFTYNILIYQFEPEPLILRGFPALLIHLSVENGIVYLKQKYNRYFYKNRTIIKELIPAVYLGDQFHQMRHLCI